MWLFFFVGHPAFGCSNTLQAFVPVQNSPCVSVFIPMTFCIFVFKTGLGHVPGLTVIYIFFYILFTCALFVFVFKDTLPLYMVMCAGS